MTGATTAGATEWILEVDPLVFVLGGASLHARVRPREHWTFGVGGASGVEIPTAFLEVPRGELDPGSARVPWALAISTDRTLGPGGDGWSLGGQVGIQKLVVGSVGGNGWEKGTGFAVARLGWRWRPFDGGFHLFPWIGLGLTETVFGDREGPAPPMLLPFGAIHAGWRF